MNNDYAQVPVYIVDDDDSVREALAYMLEGFSLNIVDFPSGESFVADTNLHTPGVVILDSRMPGMSGQDVHQYLNSQESCMTIIMLTSHGDLPMAVEAFRGGALDFYQKPVKATDIFPSIERAQKDSIEKHWKQKIRSRYMKLTGRERDVFNLVVEGKLNKQIAGELFVSLRTVEVHRSHVMERMKADSLAMLVKMADALAA